MNIIKMLKYYCLKKTSANIFYDKKQALVEKIRLQIYED